MLGNYDSLYMFEKYALKETWIFTSLLRKKTKHIILHLYVQRT